MKTTRQVEVEVDVSELELLVEAVNRVADELIRLRHTLETHGQIRRVYNDDALEGYEWK